MKSPASSSRSRLRARSKTKARPRAGLFLSAQTESTMFAWFVPPIVVPVLLAIIVIAAGMLR
jgi:hypothetical protein